MDADRKLSFVIVVIKIIHTFLPVVIKVISALLIESFLPVVIKVIYDF